MSIFCPGGAINVQTLISGGGCFDTSQAPLLRHRLRTPLDFGPETARQRNNWILFGMVVSLLLLVYLVVVQK